MKHWVHLSENKRHSTYMYMHKSIWAEYISISNILIWQLILAMLINDNEDEICHVHLPAISPKGVLRETVSHTRSVKKID